MRLNFQDPATAIMEGIIDLHHTIMFYIIIILTLVGWMLFDIVKEYGVNMYLLTRMMYRTDKQYTSIMVPYPLR